ncbi:hypothetical protein JCM19238_49 [Vibrio ponticus]|nr:hypothetical protein JCM19238_49 [Vibrio ponticus]
MAGLSGPYATVMKSSTMTGNAYDSKAAALESGHMMIVDVNRMSQLS